MAMIIRHRPSLKKTVMSCKDVVKGSVIFLADPYCNTIQKIVVHNNFKQNRQVGGTIVEYQHVSELSFDPVLKDCLQPIAVQLDWFINTNHTYCNMLAFKKHKQALQYLHYCSIDPQIIQDINYLENHIAGSLMPELPDEDMAELDVFFGD